MSPVVRHVIRLLVPATYHPQPKAFDVHAPEQRYVTSCAIEICFGAATV
jgi:hypothetical protein